MKLQEVQEINFAEWDAKSKEFAEAKAARVYLEFYRHSLLSILQKEYALEGHKTAVAQEIQARSDVRYIKLLGSLRDAVHSEETLRLELTIKQAEFEYYKIKSANTRAEMNLR